MSFRTVLSAICFHNDFDVWMDSCRFACSVVRDWVSLWLLLDIVSVRFEDYGDCFFSTSRIPECVAERLSFTRMRCAKRLESRDPDAFSSPEGPRGVSISRCFSWANRSSVSEYFLV